MCKFLLKIHKEFLKDLLDTLYDLLLKEVEFK